MAKNKVALVNNVYDECRLRVKYVFDNFERVYVSFSGGKDSTVMLHVVMDEAVKRGRTVGVLLVDLEGQYKMTIEHSQRCIEMYGKNIDLYWVCLPIHLRNGVSVYEPFWKCWDSNLKKMWVREMPKNCISDSRCFDFFADGMEFEEFVPLFGEWYSKGKTCACLVGIRADESLNRFRTIASTKKEMFNGIKWTTKVSEHVYNAYPVYDFRTRDIWIYHGKNPEKPYNKLYDFMHKAGLKISQMRICQPYGDDQRRGLWLFHLIEPETWSRVVARVNGANSGALYVQESGNINGYRKIIKPEGHSWKSFAVLLLKSMPEKTKEHYENKITKWVKWWLERGYEDGLPDAADLKLEAKRDVPSWRRVCKTLLRNDYWCKGLGYTQTKSDAYQKYLDLMRRKKAEWKIDILEY